MEATLKSKLRNPRNMPLINGQAPRSIGLKFNASDGGVRQALLMLRGLLDASGSTGSDAGMIELVLAELLNNVVEHAYSGQDGGQINVCIRDKRGLVQIWVGDCGDEPSNTSWMNRGFPDLPESTEHLPEGGFGWPIIHALSEKVRYRRHDDQNLWLVILAGSNHAQKSAKPHAPVFKSVRQSNEISAKINLHAETAPCVPISGIGARLSLAQARVFDG